MRDQTLLSLLDVLEALAAGYKDCAQRIYAAESVLIQEKRYRDYAQLRNQLREGKQGLGVESERWNESALHIEKVLAELRKKLLQSQGE